MMTENSIRTLVFDRASVDEVVLLTVQPGRCFVFLLGGFSPEEWSLIEEELDYQRPAGVHVSLHPIADLDDVVRKLMLESAWQPEPWPYRRLVALGASALTMFLWLAAIAYLL